MRTVTAWALICSMTLSPAAFADQGQVKTEKLTLKNVELGKSGTVRGKLLDRAGKPIAGKILKIHTPKSVEEVKSAKDGSFTISSRTGGNCAILVDDKAYACRLWANGTAPPKALTTIGIVHQKGAIVRGQDEGDEAGLLDSISGAQLIGLGVLAGAIAAIIIASDSDEDGS